MNSAAQLVFWDFDGVIKESVEIKSMAFESMFMPYGRDVALRVRRHHEANGGMSRFEKMPLYLKWAGLEPTAARIDEFCGRFGDLAGQGVVDAPWVPGAEGYLRSNPHGQVFVVVSATPQGELEEILSALDLIGCFAGVYGAPVAKKEAIRTVLAAHRIDPQDCIMIGDAMVDLEAAQANRVPFVLRRHGTNSAVFTNYDGPSIKDLSEL